MKIGLYIDGENIPYQFYNKLLENIEKLNGKIIFKKLYCDFGMLGINGTYNDVKNYCLKNNIKQIQVINNSGKNSSDNVIQFEIMKELKNDIVDVYIVATGDYDFINIINEIHENGKEVIGIGLSNSSSKLLKKCCDKFISLTKIDKINLSPFQDALLLLIENYEENMIHLSKVKEDILLKDSSFNEQNYNYKKFSLLIKSLSFYNRKFTIKNNCYLELLN